MSTRGNKALRILTNRRGASILLVLGVMLLFMAIGASALTAASANAGTAFNKREFTQLELYADSIQKSVKDSLFAGGDDAGAYVTDSPSSSRYPITLGGQILGAAYRNNLNLDLTPTLNVTTDLNSYITSTRILIGATVSVTPAVPERDEQRDEEGNIIVSHRPRQPQTATISGTITVTVRADNGGKSLISMATYGLSGGFLQDDGNVINMEIINAGTWRFIAHEKASI